MAELWYLVLTSRLQRRPVLPRAAITPAAPPLPCRPTPWSADQGEPTDPAAEDACRSAATMTASADGQGRGRPQVLRRTSRSSRASTSRSRRARCSASSARPARASPPSCAASTTWRRSTPAGCTVDGELVGYRQRGDKLYELKDSEVAAQAPRHRHGLPALQPVPAHDGAARTSWRRRSGSSGEAKAVARERADEAARPGRALGDKARQLPVPALRRPAAARGDRPRAGHGAQADALRRADLGARPGAGRRGARRHARPRRRAA